MGEEQAPYSAYLPAIRFTPADVAANRRGELTVDQQIRLDGIAVGRTRGAASTAKWGGLMIAVLLGAGLVIELANGGSVVGPVVAMAGMGAFFAAAIAFTYRSSSGLRNRRLSLAEGVGEAVVEQRPWTSRTNRLYTAYELQLRGGRGRRAFPFNDQASLDEVPTGQWLRVYFLENTPYPIVLSYEVVPAR
jgi:hypothetical protein